MKLGMCDIVYSLHDTPKFEGSSSSGNKVIQGQSVNMCHILVPLQWFSIMQSGTN